MKTKKTGVGCPKPDTADTCICRPDTADAPICGSEAADPKIEATSHRCLVIFEKEEEDVRTESSHDHQALIDAGLDFILQSGFFGNFSPNLPENPSERVDRVGLSSSSDPNLNPQCPGTRQSPQCPGAQQNPQSCGARQNPQCPGARQNPQSCGARRTDAAPLFSTALSHNTLPHGRLEKDKNGRPFLVNYPDIHISISDSGDYTVCAFTSVPVGIDLQETRFLHQTPLRLAERFFTSSEYEMIRSAETGEKQADLFCRLWTIKESCLKCTGQGLAGGLDTFQPDFSKGQVFPSSEHPSDPPFPSLFFTELTALNGYHLTIASPVRFCREEIQYFHI